jgi:predicted DsbA family dithiol-disulfide isomerase
MEKYLDLYVQDCTDLSIWYAICEGLGFDGEKVDHIVISWNTAKAYQEDQQVVQSIYNNLGGK